MTAISLPQFVETDSNEQLFSKIADDLYTQGYCIMPNALPYELCQALLETQHELSDADFHAAGIGREQNHQQNQFVRSDEICWITGSSDAGQAWLSWADELKTYLNRRLFLGLFSFESHFSHYPPGSFYKRHVDAFKGQASRVLSMVAYLNPDWQLDDGGELVIYDPQDDAQSVVVTPLLGTIALFLSEEFPHEVRVAKRDRYAIAGWYRVNSSTADKVDPPR